jgi:DNA topoisomerase-1
MLRFSREDDGPRPAALREASRSRRGLVGLITYMRTDSSRVSQDALVQARELIEKQYGPKYLPEKPNSTRARRRARRKRTRRSAHRGRRGRRVAAHPRSTATSSSSTR